MQSRRGKQRSCLCGQNGGGGTFSMADVLHGLRESYVSMEVLVKNWLQSFSFVVALVLTLGLGGLLHAQSQDQPQQSQPDQTQSQQSPARQSENTQEFIGTIVKSGDKWMFQDSASGKSYDIDHQEVVKKFEGKKVKVHGTMDPDGKTIHVQ
jgi:hypothetical protein